MRRKILFILLTLINKILPKFDQVMLHGNSNLDDNTIAIAKYIVENYKIKVYFGVSKDYIQYAQKILPKEIIIIPTRTYFYFKKYLTSKYIFFTTGSFLNTFSKRQVAVNVWHGILYKKVKKLRGYPGVPAHVTVATSPLTQIMFSAAFGVPENDMVISGYPRNDVLLNSKNEKFSILNRLDGNLKSFKKVILWMPTFRQSTINVLAQDGRIMDNPFNLDLFDVYQFNELLKSHDSICLVKPHPAAQNIKGFNDLSNLKYIDDKWIVRQGITLYQLVGCSDMLISDLSSIIADYLLLDNPVLCVCSDLDTYQNTRGFYFENIEDWLPGKVINNQQELSELLSSLLTTGIDACEAKRKGIKDLFFSQKDCLSTKRLVEYVFNNNVSRR